MSSLCIFVVVAIASCVIALFPTVAFKLRHFAVEYCCIRYFN